MIYVDANLFIHAYWKPRKPVLAPKTQWIKAEAKKIVTQINEENGSFCISLIQLSEVSNILKTVMTWDQLKDFLWGLISNPSIEVVEVNLAQYVSAIDKISELRMHPNDILAYLIMQDRKITEIYTFDQNFNRLSGITILPRAPTLK